MTNKKDREMFEARIVDAGGTVETARLIMRHATTAQRIAVIACNRELTTNDERRDAIACNRIKKLCEALPKMWRVTHQEFYGNDENGAPRLGERKVRFVAPLGEGGENACFQFIHDAQSNSVEWATKYEGWRIEEIGTVPNFSGDPRGFVVKLHFPNGACNTWGGESSGFGVPVTLRESACV